ncbi:MAG: O-antigen ligase C-terminal domain-containing protein [Nitrospirae bacterium]|nr:O-antigen ligase C-terminal domain-containing protein [Nitrospirota bacterium]
MNKETPRNFSIALLYLFFLLLIHISIRNIGSSTATPVSYMAWMAASLLFFSSFIRVFFYDGARYVSPHITPYIAVFLCLVILPAFFNPIYDMPSFIFRKAGLTGGMLFFLSLHQLELNDDEKERLLYVIFISGFIEACIGLFQYFLPGLRIPFVAYSTPGIIYGNFQHHNLLASFLATSLVISLFAVSGSFFDSLKRHFKMLFYLMSGVISFTLFLTGSRTGLIGLVLGCGVLFFAKQASYRKAPGYLAVWLLAIALGFGSNFITEKFIYQKERGVFSTAGKLRVTVESLTGEKDSDPRLLMYRTSYEMFKDKPLLGHGPDGFISKYVYYRRVAAAERFDRAVSIGTFTNHPHNEFLSILIESGIAGGAGLLILISVFALYLFRLGREKGGLYASLLLPIGLHSQVEFPFYQSAAHWLLFLFLLYLPSSFFTHSVIMPKANLLRKALFAVAACIVVLINIFLFRTLKANADLTEYYRLLTSEGVNRTEIIKPALNNLYLGQFTRRMLMDIRLGAALKKNDNNFLLNYVEWAEEERKHFPHFMLFEGEARALFILGRKKEAYAMLDEGLSLYPDNSLLKETNKELGLMDNQ